MYIYLQVNGMGLYMLELPTIMTQDAKAGGDIAGGARKKLEKRLGRSIVSKENYLPKERKI